mgnify:CR=1 FL=1|jgi:hypothetical protein
MSLEGKDPRGRWQRIVAGYQALREEERRDLAGATLSERIEIVEALQDFMEEVERMAGSSAASPFREMIRRLHRILEENRIPYVIIGGLAAALWGIARTTVDVDVVLTLSSDQLSFLLDRLQEAGFRADPGAVLRLQEGRPVKLFFTRRFSVDLRQASFQLDREAIRRAREVELFGLALRVATPEDLIVYKLARWGPIDEQDMQAVLESQRGSLDWNYIEAAVRDLAQEADLPELLVRWSRLKEEIAG